MKMYTYIYILGEIGNASKQQRWRRLWQGVDTTKQRAHEMPLGTLPSNDWRRLPRWLEVLHSGRFTQTQEEML